MGLGLDSVGLLFMQAFSLYDLWNQWNYAGVFDLLLPFLLIFALVFGILTSTRILGGHRGVNLIIALVIALMALRLNFVSVFFSELFPRFAVGLVVLVIIVIMAGLFISPESRKGWFIGFSIFGVVIGVIVTIFTFNTTSYWFDSFFWQDYWGLIVGGIIMVVLIIAVFTSAGKPSEHKDWGQLEPLRKSFAGG